MPGRAPRPLARLAQPEGSTPVRIQVERDVLAEAVAWTARALPARPTVPVIAGMRLHAAAELTLSSFDYDVSAQAQIPVTAEEEGSALVSGRLLAEISRSLPLPNPLRIGAGVNTGSAILGGTEYTALGDTVNAAFRLEAATKSIGLGVALGDRTFAELGLATEAPFARREVALKGYEALKTAWGISFEELQAFLASRP